MTLELGRVTDRNPPFKYAALARVGFSDTDAQGIVYYGRYMPYFDTAQREYLRHLGLLGSNVERERFVMRAMSVEYHAPARFDDLLEVFVRVSRIGRTSLTTAFAAHRGENDVLLCTAQQTAVLVDATTGRPMPIPDAYRAVVRSFEGHDLEEGSRR
jgi:acyl-CoA thioester hydrolase